MRKIGLMILPLHGGHVPSWLVERMKRLSGVMVKLIVEEKGPKALLENLSDPLWFQAFGSVLGFDWHSSGLTTVVCGILKDALSLDGHGVAVAGGKAAASRRALKEIEALSLKANISTPRMERMRYASRMCAKVDSAAIQAGYPLYHHSFFMTEQGEWCVVQQGMNTVDRTARRYHWLSDHVRSMVIEPHEGIVGDVRLERVLNMTAKEAEEGRKVSLDLVREPPQHLRSSIIRLSSKDCPLDAWSEGGGQFHHHEAYLMPRRLDWKAFTELYDRQPEDYEELLAFRGVGPAAIRALALVAELIYGARLNWSDPVKFTFAHGGKDGVPYPVDRKLIDGTIERLESVLEGAELTHTEKVEALGKLAKLSKQWGL